MPVLVVTYHLIHWLLLLLLLLLLLVLFDSNFPALPFHAQRFVYFLRLEGSCFLYFPRTFG